MNNTIDITNRDYYNYPPNPENDERTKKRLEQLVAMNLIDFGNAQFGMQGIVSGLYIEMVWRYSDEDWRGYIDWMQSVIDRKRNEK